MHSGDFSIRSHQFSFIIHLKYGISFVLVQIVQFNCFHCRSLNFCTLRKCTICIIISDKCVDKYFVQSSSVVLFSFVILHNAILCLLFEICNTQKLVHRLTLRHHFYISIVVLLSWFLPSTQKVSIIFFLKFSWFIFKCKTIIKRKLAKG